jgi:hypothetical protein
MEGLQGSPWDALENTPSDEADQPNKAASEEALARRKGAPTSSSTVRLRTTEQFQVLPLVATGTIVVAGDALPLREPVGLLATHATQAREPSPRLPEMLVHETRLWPSWIGCV